MTNITNVTVVFERGVKPADYESKKAIVTLSAVVGDGENAADVLNAVGVLAQTKALELVGLRTAPNTGAAGAAGTGSQPLPAQAPAPAAPASQSAPGTKEAAAAAMNAAEASPIKPKRAPKAATTASAGAASEAGSAAATAAPANDPPAAPATGGELSWDDEAPKAAKPISDVELNDAAQKKFKEIGKENGAGAAIRELTAKFIPEGKALNGTNIPQEKRAAYLDALAALKKA